MRFHINCFFLLVGMVGQAFAQGAYTTSTVFATQNSNLSAPTTLGINFYDLLGAPAFTDSHGISGGYGYILDQAAQTLPGFTQGSAVLSSADSVASVVFLKGTSVSANSRFDAYAGLPPADTGTTLYVPQFMRSIPSGGGVYDSLLVIQNTGTLAANVSVLYQAIYFGTTQTITYNNVPSLSSVYIRSQDLTTIGDGLGKFYGYVIVTSTNSQPLAVVATVGSGESGSATGGIIAQKGFSSPITSASGEIFGGQMYKYINSATCSFSSALSIVNVGTVPANITVKYYPSNGIPAQYTPPGGPWSYTISLPDRLTDATGSMISLDQRYDANITTGTFYGGVSLQVTNAGQIVAISNNRGSGCTDPTNQLSSSVPVELNSGTKLLGPMIFKNDQAGSSLGSAFSWSSAIGVQNLASSTTNIRVTYYPFSGAATTTYDTSIASNTSLNIDQRYDANLTAGTFAGSVVIQSLTAGNNIRGSVNVRGNYGPSADALGAYNLQALP
jgi:hypothetical protein